MATTAKTYDRQTAGFLAVVGQNMPELPSAAMQQWIENPMALQNALRDALCPRRRACAFPTWKTVTIGKHENHAALVKDLRGEGFKVSAGAMFLLHRLALAGANKDIELVLVTVADLGFTMSASLEAIYERAEKLRLYLAPAEVGPQLRLAYPDQPMGEWMAVAMNPINDEWREPSTFLLQRDGCGQQLTALRSYPKSTWSPGYRFVFANQHHRP